MNPAQGFDRLAGLYRGLELLAFGRELERARFALLPQLQYCRHILVLGDGDGRGLQQLVALNPTAEYDCLDLSPVMLSHARQRLAATPHNIRFQEADILTATLPDRHFDAVVTCFFLDCFDADTAAGVVAIIAASLAPDARWLWADFAVPAHGPARARARLWLATLYFFFRWQTGIKARTLPPSEALIAAAGFAPIATASRQWGLLRSVVFQATAA
ncbi:MAG: class I SAM-dependent methyltransferase [Cephaloticoccus sp.]|nr:class I SAM-dependent methyltransferase [Cephaloticoccus sp.]MCF7759050.1 class I SAM-dependent methyltransferase [Cephaloticoccus sp.]